MMLVVIPQGADSRTEVGCNPKGLVL